MFASPISPRTSGCNGVSLTSASTGREGNLIGRYRGPRFRKHLGYHEDHADKHQVAAELAPAPERTPRNQRDQECCPDPGGGRDEQQQVHGAVWLIGQTHQRFAGCGMPGGERSGLRAARAANGGFRRRNEPSDGQKNGNADEQPNVTGLYCREHHPAMWS
jgi:hypothetical protein